MHVFAHPWLCAFVCLVGLVVAQPHAAANGTKRIHLVNRHLKQMSRRDADRDEAGFWRHAKHWQRLAANVFGAMALTADGAHKPRPTVSRKEAEALFAELAASRLGFGYQDYCFDRAHVAAAALLSRGIASHKVHVSFTRRTGQRVDAPLHPKGRFLWSQHIAPAVYVQDGGFKQLVILDPSLFAGPVALEAFQRRLGATPTNAKVRILEGAQYDVKQKADPRNGNQVAYSLYRVSHARRQERRSSDFLRMLEARLDPGR